MSPTRIIVKLFVAPCRSILSRH